MAEVGGISCAFNSTVYEKTLPFVPDILEWARRNADKVHVVVFIAFRAAIKERFDYFAGEEKMELADSPTRGPRRSAPTSTPRRSSTSCKPASRSSSHAAYLNGTEKPDSFKWLMTLLVGDKDRFYGSAGPKFVELSQMWNHLVKGRYLGLRAPLAARQRPHPARALGGRPRPPSHRRRLGPGRGP